MREDETSLRRQTPLTDALNVGAERRNRTYLSQMDGAGRSGQGPNAREIRTQKVTFRNELLKERQGGRLSTKTRGRHQRRDGVTAFARRQRQQEDRLRCECVKRKVGVTPSRRQLSIKNKCKIPLRNAHRRNRLRAPKAFHELRKEGVTARIKPRNEANHMADRGAVARQGAHGRTPGRSDVRQEVGDRRRRRLKGVQATRVAESSEKAPARLVGGVGAGKARTAQLK